VSGSQTFSLPDLGEGLKDAVIVQWLVSVGDVIELNQPVCEVETEKAEVELPSPFAGVVAQLLAEEGQRLPVGSPLIVIADTALDNGPDAAVSIDSSDSAVTGEEAPPQPLVGYGPGAGSSHRTRNPLKRPLAPLMKEASTPPLHRPSPMIRRLIESSGIDVSLLQASQPGGYLSRAEVENLIDQAQHSGTAESSEPGVGDLSAEEIRTPVTGVRARVAERMTQSRQQIPDASCSIDVDMTDLWEMRKVMNESDPTVRISISDLVTFACVRSIVTHPEIQSRFDDVGPTIVTPSTIGVGIAIDSSQGLVVGVIKRAETATLRDISTRSHELAAQAREGPLGLDAVTGGTFTISNYGSLGLDDAVPIINYPQGSILGVGAINQRPWVVDNLICVRRVMRCTLVFDHRIHDGGGAAKFMRTLRQMLTDPGMLLLS